jgi:uncharacterized protein YukE
MTISHGMNIDEVRNLGNQLRQQAQHIEQLVAQLEGQINSTSWMGADANTFKHDWWPQHRQHLHAAATGLDGFGQSALNNAQEQEQVSSR